MTSPSSAELSQIQRQLGTHAAWWRGSLVAKMTPAAFAQKASRGRWQLARHLEMLDRCLMDLTAGRAPRLMTLMPPRHGKSEMISKYFPAWFLGVYPDKRIILSGHQAEFAASWGRKVRDLLDEVGAKLFGIRLRRDSSAADRWDLAGREGGMVTAGVGGPITGRGADLLIIDDPVKNAEQAHSQTFRDKVWDWYLSTAYTRLEPDGRVVLVQTRWHEDDLAGRLLAQASQSAPAAESWYVLQLPALAEVNDPLERQPGEALWPDRFDVPALQQRQRALGSYWFSAMYQQRPTPPEGAIFRKTWFRYWASQDEFFLLDGHAVRRDDCWRFGSVDLALSERTNADYTVIASWAVTAGGELILLDLIRDRLSAPKIVPLIRRTMARFSLDYVAIERVAIQEAIVQQARRAGLSIRPVRPQGDKISRAGAASVRFEAGCVYFPRAATWLDDLEAELLHFPVGAHDDQVDAVSYACLEVGRHYSLPALASGAAEDEWGTRGREDAATRG